MYPIWEQRIFMLKLVAACSNPSVIAQIAAASSNRIKKFTPSVLLFPQSAINKASAKRPDNNGIKNSRVNSNDMININYPIYMKTITDVTPNSQLNLKFLEKIFYLLMNCFRIRIKGKDLKWT